MYSFVDYLLPLAVVVPFTLWIALEFLGLMRLFARISDKLSTPAPASAQEAAQRVEEHVLVYAATRNAKQRRIGRG